MTRIAKTGLNNSQSALAAANDLRVVMQGKVVTAGELINAAAPYGLVAVASTTGAVGMAGLTLGGGYPNLLGPEECARSLLSYGGNIARLRDVKRHWDPDGVFSATPLPA